MEGKDQINTTPAAKIEDDHHQIADVHQSPPPRVQASNISPPLENNVMTPNSPPDSPSYYVDEVPSDYDSDFDDDLEGMEDDIEDDHPYSERNMNALRESIENLKAENRRLQYEAHCLRVTLSMLERNTEHMRDNHAACVRRWEDQDAEHQRVIELQERLERYFASFSGPSMIPKNPGV